MKNSLTLEQYCSLKNITVKQAEKKVLDRKLLLPVDYADLENIDVAAVRMRVGRGKLISVYILGRSYVDPETEKSIRKPRNILV